MAEKNKKDLGLVVATKEEALWIDVKKRAEEKIIDCENALIFNKAMLELAKSKIKSEKKKPDMVG